jgi:transposase-like protein
MRAPEMRRLLDVVQRLTPRQRGELLRLLQVQPAQAQVEAMVESRLDGKPTCPHCQTSGVVRNGHADGLQRYKCRACAKTFNALSGTPLARLRHKAKWLDQADALQAGLVLRQVAERLHVAVSTAFRWRHRFLLLPQELKARLLQGIVEVDETYGLRSFKGQRVVGRRSRRRGGKASTRGMSHEHVPILVARDRAGATMDAVLKVGNIAQISAALRPVLAQDAVVCTDGSLMLASVAKALDVEHHALNLRTGVRVRGPWHIQNVNAYHSRFKGWLHRFHGVSTSYLSSYLGWFRAIERFRQHPGDAAQMLAWAVGV